MKFSKKLCDILLKVIWGSCKHIMRNSLHNCVKFSLKLWLNFIMFSRVSHHFTKLTKYEIGQKWDKCTECFLLVAICFVKLFVKYEKW